MFTVEPTRSNIMVRIDQASRVKSRIANGIDTENNDWKEKKPGFVTGVVQAVGPGVDYVVGNEIKRIKPMAHIGDVVVLLNHWNSSEMEIDGDLFRLIEDASIIAILKRK